MICTVTEAVKGMRCRQDWQRLLKCEILSTSFRDLYAKVEAKNGRGQISSACMITGDIGFSAVGSDLSLNYV
jgi:hypothetical protein